jgi:hypothetical protein
VNVDTVVANFAFWVTSTITSLGIISRSGSQEQKHPPHRYGQKSKERGEP